MSKLTKALTAAAGNAGGGALYVEDVFSTYLYTGNASTQTVTNGIDLSGEGGLVWTKNRANAFNNFLYDTERGATNYLISDSTIDQQTVATSLTSFNSDGFTLGANDYGNIVSGAAAVSWSFRKAEKFFDVVTWTGDGTGARTISHSLNGTVGALFMKATNADMQWFSYHNGLTNAQFLELNATTSAVSSTNAWNNTTPTSSEFTVGSYGNISGRTYVAYLFASDAGGFGDDGSESIIKCGSYVGDNSATGPIIDLGFEPQWLLIKDSSASANWTIIDNMRGWSEGKYSDQPQLFPNTSGAEDAGLFAQVAGINATGFIAGGQRNNTGNTYIYIAIRRPMKTPESGTEVFATAFDAGGTSPTYVSGFVADMGIQTNTTGYNKRVSSRLTSGKYLEADNTGAEQTSASNYTWDFMNGWNNQTINSTWLSWMFKRATGFFDVVAYSGDGVAGSTQAHNLGVVPEFMVIKQRSGANNWICGGTILGTDGWMFLNSNLAQDTQPAYWNNTLPAATQFTVGSATAVNETSQTYIAYLFATLDGVSKVFSVTKSSGSNADVDCGFSAGARFILLKRTDSTGDWYVWDSVRGIVTGNDPYLLLNSTAAEVTSTDYIDPLSSGFTIVDGGLANGDYIGLAIA